MKYKLYKCKYSDCNIEQPILNRGLCNFHRNKDKEKPLKRYILRQTTKNKLKKQEKSEIMRPFWEYHLSILEKNNKSCENCEKKLQPSVVYIAHIIPKRRHFSVASDLNNCIYLCDTCHNRFDRIQSTNQVYLMKVFPTAVERYLKFRDNITEYSKYKEIFENWIEQN